VTVEELRPTLGLDMLYPRDAVYMSRTDLFETRMLGYTDLLLDTITAMLIGLLNGRSTIRHEAAAGPEVLDIFRCAGIRVAEDMHTYRTKEEAEALADAMIGRGKRLFWAYPLSAGRFPDSSHLVPLALYRYLNSKASLGDIVSAQYRPKRHTLSHEDLANFNPTNPVFLKSSGDAATGWGFAVHYCPDQVALSRARNWFRDYRDSVPAVIVEEAVPLIACWCAGVAVHDDGSQCFGGAEQLFSAPARQSGSIIDPETAFPPEGRLLAVQVGEAGRALGFRGICGVDIGLGHDGRIRVFDPNFRLASSTSQLLYYGDAVARSGLPVSRSFQTRPGGRFQDLARRLAGPIEEGWFVPTRLFNGEKHPLSEGRHIVTGFVLANTRKEVESVAGSLERLL
jgi:hypothetical protein